MPYTRRQRNYFFGPSGTTYTKFSTLNRPTAERFKELFHSIPFFNELESMAGLRIPGLIALSTKEDMLSLVDTYSGIPLAVTPGKLPVVFIDIEEFPYVEGLFVDKNNKDSHDPLFNPTIITAKGITIKEVFGGNNGQHIFSIYLAVDGDKFEFDEDGKLKLKEGSVGADEITGHLPVDIIGGTTDGILVGGIGEVGAIEEVNLPTGSLIYKTEDGYGYIEFGGPGRDLKLVGNNLAYNNASIELIHHAYRVSGSILVGDGTSDPLVERVLNTQGAFLMGLSTGGNAVVNVGGVLSVDDTGAFSYNDLSIGARKIAANFIADGLEFIDIGSGNKSIGSKVQKSIDKDGNGLKLVNDEKYPGVSKYYGVDKTGTKGYHVVPTGVLSAGAGTDSVKQSSADSATKKYSWSEGVAKNSIYGAKIRAISDNLSRIQLHYEGTTTDDSAVELFLGGESAERLSLLMSSDDLIYNITAKITASVTSDSYKSYFEKREVLVKNISLTISNVHSDIINEYSESTLANTNISIAGDNSTKNLIVEVTGIAASDISWGITLDIDRLKV
jgi:hypothetical protein